MNALRVRPGRELTRLLDAFGFAAPSDVSWAPRADVVESETALTVRYELAGFHPDDLRATVEDNVLTVTGERAFPSSDGDTYRRRELAQGSFTRSIRIPEGCDPGNVRASFTGGILEVTVGKHPEVLPKTVEIEAA